MEGGADGWTPLALAALFGFRCVVLEAAVAVHSFAAIRWTVLLLVDRVQQMATRLLGGQGAATPYVETYLLGVVGRRLPSALDSRLGGVPQLAAELRSCCSAAVLVVVDAPRPAYPHLAVRMVGRLALRALGLQAWAPSAAVSAHTVVRAMNVAAVHGLGLPRLGALDLLASFVSTDMGVVPASFVETLVRFLKAAAVVDTPAAAVRMLHVLDTHLGMAPLSWGVYGVLPMYLCVV